MKRLDAQCPATSTGKFRRIVPKAVLAEAAADLDWDNAPSKALGEANPPVYRWSLNGELNVSRNALDRHVEAGRGAQAVLICVFLATNTKRTYTYAQLRNQYTSAEFP